MVVGPAIEPLGRDLRYGGGFVRRQPPIRLHGSAWVVVRFVGFESGRQLHLGGPEGCGERGQGGGGRIKHSSGDSLDLHRIDRAG